MPIPHVSQERWLERRLHEHRVPFCWITDADARRERFRAAIIAGFVDQAIVGKNLAGKAETYAQLFERIFNEPLWRQKPKLKGK